MQADPRLWPPLCLLWTWMWGPYRAQAESSGVTLAPQLSTPESQGSLCSAKPIVAHAVMRSASPLPDLRGAAQVGL